MIVLAVVGMLMVIGVLMFLWLALGSTSAFALLVVGLVLIVLAMHGGSRAKRRG